MRTFMPLIFVLPFTLSACGGSTTSNVDNFNSIGSTKIAAIADEIDNSQVTELTATPTENSASMNGIFVIEATTPSSVDGVGGQMSMNANFAAGTVNGSMTDLFEIEDFAGERYGSDITGSANYSGTLNVGAGGGNDIAATGTGSYVGTDGVTYNANLTLDGAFFRRPNTDLGAVGFIDATVTGGGSNFTGEGAYIVAE
ncbi:MAG: hypothetical protein VX444_10435 [Pseudomonadota bacterium]|nr:hypothetical protein [Pseudomonadota bacterium]